MNKTIEEVKHYYEQCKAFWVRQGNSEAVASCKAFWWDIVQISNQWGWTDAKEQFALECCGYKPYDPEPTKEEVEAGTCRHP